MASSLPLPAPDDWRTTDQDEINRRRLRAREESPRIANRDERFPIFSNFDVHSPSGVDYEVEIRDLRARVFGCTCVDFRVNDLGTCKHIEAVLEQLETQRGPQYAEALARGSDRIDLAPDHAAQTLRVERNAGKLPRALRRLFDPDGRLAPGYLLEMALDQWTEAAKTQPELRASQEVPAWLECKRREREGVALRRAYEQNVQSGIWPAQETRLPLFPYQREGMLHLACVERALLADEMGLGKTVQAVAACALLRRLGRVKRVLVVTPASLQAEWEEQIERFTRLPHRRVEGARGARLKEYERAQAPFFTLATYDQMLTDALEVNARLQPEVVILDEAQRIKNWNAKTALAVKRLASRYAWVLTGMSLESRIDELYSLVSFLDPSIFGPLFRFNREFYEFDERGRPRGFRNLEKLRERIRPIVLRRRKADVQTELPHRIERTFLVPLGDSQRAEYARRAGAVARLLAAHRRRPLPAAGQERLMREANVLRMLCDTRFILGDDDRACPKVDELARLLPDCVATPHAKVLIFSEWERMLELVGALCRKLRIDFAFHAGGAPAGRRRAEMQRFRADPACRVLLSTDSAGASLDLPGPTVIIHCDVPWTTARRDQRLARAGAGDGVPPLTVFNLVSQGTIEQRLLTARPTAEDFATRLLELLPGLPREERPKPAAPPAAPRADDPPARFARGASELLDGALLACEERFPSRGEGSVVLAVVESDAEGCHERLRALETATLGAGIRLEVMDRPTAEMLRRLAESGVVSPSLRASRVLYPKAGGGALTPGEEKRLAGAREQHARHLRVAAVLVAEEMIEEARGAVTAAVHELGRALAIEHGLPEPANALGAVAPPLDAYWPGGDPALLAARTFLEDANAPILPLLQVLGRPADAGERRAREFFEDIKAKLGAIRE